MIWKVCFALSLTSFLAGGLTAFIKGKRKYKSGSIMSVSRILFLSVVLSAVFLFFPINKNVFAESESGLIETVLISMHNVIRLFVVDGEFEFVTTNISGLTGGLYKAYSILASILFVLAPILTFEFVLSFFQNFNSYQKFLFNYGKPAYVFSELNEKSLALVESLIKSPGKKIFVFTDVFQIEEEKNYELVERAKEFGAICFKKDIITIDFSKHKSNAPIFFYTIGEDESENIGQSIKLISKYKDRKFTHLYVFSTRFDAEMLLTSVDKGEIKVRRVNEVKSLVYRNLYENGSKIFDCARQNDGKISAVVIGMGKHGTEMVKALSWFCQMDGYSVRINAFDSDELTEDRFVGMCPELMSEKYNRQLKDDGDSQYKINIHCKKDPETDLKMDVNGIRFYKELEKITPITYVFIALGSDEANIRVAIEIRAMLERTGNKNVFIQSIVYDTEKKEALKGIKNYSGQDYGINFIGDMKTSYSAEVIMKSDLEEKALNRHLKWGKEETFWNFEYNYRSSIASAIHKEMKKYCKIPDVELPPNERSEENRIALRKLEHRRWNTYMRSEGYSWSGSIDESTRNNLAKLHCFLVPFDELPLKEQQKDDN